MPRNNRGAHIVLDDNTFYNEINSEPIRPVKDYLKNFVWKLIKEYKKDEKIECSICLEEVDCQKCYSLLTCGHSFHMSCIYKCNSCPLCRNS